MPACPKPRNPKLDRADRRKAVMAHERREKAKVRKRDGICRWPRCCCVGQRAWMYTTEVAHLNDKGMGGDHGLQSTADQMILLCHMMHQGPTSLHAGNARIVPLTSFGTDGPCRFQIKHGRQWRNIAAERTVGVL